MKKVLILEKSDLKQGTSIAGVAGTMQRIAEADIVLAETSTNGNFLVFKSRDTKAGQFIKSDEVGCFLISRKPKKEKQS
jgi:hypothetical protein